MCRPRRKNSRSDTVIKDMIMTRSKTRSRTRITYQVHWVKGLIISPYWLAQMVHKELFKIPPEIFLKVPNKYNFSLV